MKDHIFFPGSVTNKIISYLTLRRSVVTDLTLKNSTFYPDCIPVIFYGSQGKNYLIHAIKRLAKITKTACVYCAVRHESNTIQAIFNFLMGSTSSTFL